MTRNIISSFESETKPSLYAFGYGSTYDHVLRSLAESSGGTFYHVESPESIPLAFADTLGGLLHVAAQNVSLMIEIPDKSTSIVNSILTKFPMQMLSDFTSVIRLSDIYVGEGKDVLVRLRIPCAMYPSVINIRVTLNYIDVIHESVRAVTSIASVTRTKQKLQPIIEDTEVVRHCIRVDAVNALESARQSAEKGDLKRSVTEIESSLKSANEKLAKMQISSKEDPMLSNVLDDLRDVGEAIRQSSDVTTYHSKAEGKVYSAGWSHSQQRSNKCSAEEDFSCYQVPVKAKMMSKIQESLNKKQ